MYGKIEKGILTLPPKFKDGIINYDKNEQKLIEDGYKEVIYTEPEIEPAEEQELYCTYEETEDAIIQVWGVRDIDRNVLISRYKKQFEETDYKIIKCTEYQLAGLELPYDISELHTERQALRDRINALEAES